MSYWGFSILSSTIDFIPRELIEPLKEEKKEILLTISTVQMECAHNESFLIEKENTVLI